MSHAGIKIVADVIITREALARRQRIWRKMIGEIEPELRDLIRDDPEGQEAIVLGIAVEDEAQREEMNENQT